MPTGEQVKSLIRSASDEDRERFYTVALQVAAHEAKNGHSSLAHEIRDLVDAQKTTGGKLKVVPFTNDLKGLVISERPTLRMPSMVLNDTLSTRVNRIIHEYHQRARLKQHGLSHRRKILLAGSPGTGKTMTARVLAGELNLPLHIVQVDRLVTKFMGETSAKLRLIFDYMVSNHGVFLFDEFDAIGGDRSLDNDVGEMRRVLNAFLQFIEQDTSDSLIIGATNNPKLLDRALFRRFDDVLHYESPDKEERKLLIGNLLAGFQKKRFPWTNVLNVSANLSHSEITIACSDAIKIAILDDNKYISASILTDCFTQRSDAYITG